MSSKTTPIKIRPEVLAVPGYKQGQAPANLGYKLSSNENPYPPLRVVLDAIADRTDFNRYTAADVTKLRENIAATENERQLCRQSTAAARGGNPLRAVAALQQLKPLSAANVHVLGAGSVAILYQLIGATCGPANNYVYPWPSFEAYPLLGTVPGATGKPVPLTAAGRHDLTAMAAAVDDATGAVLLCSPNNPTGPTITAAEFKDFMQRVPHDVMVVLDEAYAEFVTDAAAVDGVSLLHNYPNLVVLRTFAKAQGLAGLRLGYGFAAPEIWAAVSPAAIPMSVNALSEAAALAALSDEGQREITARVATLVQRRAELVRGLTQLGLTVPAAQGNFVWIPAAQLAAAPGAGGEVDPPTAYAAQLAAQGILVRPFAGHGVRISVAEAESIPAVLAATATYLGQESV